jgi:hypothetical protein
MVSMLAAQTKPAKTSGTPEATEFRVWADNAIQTQKAYLAACAEHEHGAVQHHIPIPARFRPESARPCRPDRRRSARPYAGRATAFCGDGSYSAATSHAQACVGHKRGQQFFR